MTTAALPRCRYCERRHSNRYLCDPARRILAGLEAKADSYNMPTIDFEEPLVGSAGDTIGFGKPGDAIVVQLVVKSLVAEVGGVWRAALVFTGRSNVGVLPQWLFLGGDADIRRTTALVADRGEAAIAAATAARETGLS